MWSASTKQLVMIELTAPCEERMEDAYERKKGKYQDIVDESKEKGWKVWCMPVEVGCRGFPGQSLWRTLRVLGVIGKRRKQMIRETGKAAEEASLSIWRKREER